MKNNIQYLKEEVKIYERGILTLLLEISRSFSDESFTKEKRDEMFIKIDDLRDKVKDINKVITDLQKSEKDIEEYTYINKKEYEIENLIKLEQKSEKIDSLISNEKDENEDSNVDECIGTEEKIDLDNTNKSMLNIARRNRRNNETNIVENNSKEIEEKNNTVENVKEDNLIQDIEEIDRLIEEAQNLNNNIIKFPDNRRKSEVDENENECLGSNQENEGKCKDPNIDVDVVEPVPVLFGNTRVQNQMIIRKKSNGFSDKLKSLIFKIKNLLGGEDEQ